MKTELQDTAPLDLLSISQTKVTERSEETLREDLCSEIFCTNNAPYFAVPLTDKTYALVQGNCHDWTCPRCGIQRAKQEYGRIVEGCRTLAKEHDIYFITLTCRGRELSLEDSEKNYLKWTNRLLTACRTSAKRKEIHWAYVQVTERQKRLHPHSHILTTYAPHDLRDDFKKSWKTENGKRVYKNIPCLRSDWFEKRCISAGLGNQYDISKVETVEGASRYVAKYLFKDSMFTTEWAKNWHRVRYSQSFPKLEKRTSNAIVLITQDDWNDFGKYAGRVKTRTNSAFETARYKLKSHAVNVIKTDEVML